MIVTTIDPVTGNRVTDLEQQPFIVEGDGIAAVKIYFESEDTKRAYLMAQADDTDLFGEDTTQFHRQ